MYNTAFDITAMNTTSVSFLYDSYSNKIITMIKFRNISGFRIFPEGDRLETSINKIRCPFDLKLWRVEPYNWNLVSVHSYKEYLRFFDFVLRGELFSTPMGLKLHFVLYLKAIEYIFECRDSQTDQFELVTDLVWHELWNFENYRKCLLWL